MNRNSEMQSLLNSSDSTCARTFQAKYTRVEDVDLPPSRRRYHMPNLQFATLRGKSSDQKKPQSLDYSVCYNTPYREFIQKNATKRFIGNFSVARVKTHNTVFTSPLILSRCVTEDLGERSQLDYGRYNRCPDWSGCIPNQFHH